MTASWYHSGSLAVSVDGTAGARAIVASSVTAGSEEVVEVVLAPQARTQLHHMNRHALRVEADVVSRAVPQVVGAADQVVQLVGLVGLQAERGDVEFDPAALGVVRIEVDDAHDGVAAVRRGLGIRDE